MRVAALGDWTSIAGFKAVGVEVREVENPEDGPRAWSEMPAERYAVVLVTEPVYAELRRRVAGFPARDVLPVVLEIPAVTGTQGTARSGLRELMVRALGTVPEER